MYDQIIVFIKPRYSKTGLAYIEPMLIRSVNTSNRKQAYLREIRDALNIVENGPLL